MRSHNLSDEQKKLYLNAVISGTASVLGAEKYSDIPTKAVEATFNPYERIDESGNRVRHFHNFGHGTRAAEIIIPEMEDVRKSLEKFIKDNEDRLLTLSPDRTNEEFARQYAIASFKAFGIRFDDSKSIKENIEENANNPSLRKLQDASGLNKTGIMHDLVYNVDGKAEEKWLEYVTKGENALLKLSEDGKHLEWNERGKESVLYKLLAPTQGKEKSFDLEGKRGALEPYPTNFAEAPIYNELLSAVTALQQDMDQGVPKTQQLRRSVEIIGTYYCKSEQFSDELYERFAVVGKSYGMADSEIKHSYQVALDFTNKFDVRAFRGDEEGSRNFVLSLTRFVDELEASKATRNQETATEFDRANVGANWFSRNIALVGLIKNLTIQRDDSHIPDKLKFKIKDFLSPYMNDEGKIDGKKLDKVFGTGTAEAYENAKPVEIFRGLPRAALAGESPNNYIIDSNSDGNVTKLEANLKATKSYVDLARTLQAISATSMLIGAILQKQWDKIATENENAPKTPPADLNIMPLHTSGKNINTTLSEAVMDRLQNPERETDVFGENRQAGHKNDKIAASLLELVGHEKMAKLAALQAEIVMGAKFSGKDARVGLSENADLIVVRAKSIMGDAVVSELETNIHKAIKEKSLAEATFTARPSHVVQISKAK